MFKLNLLATLIVLSWLGMGSSKNTTLARNQTFNKNVEMPEEQSLYSSEDNVTILTANNFKHLVYGRKHAVLIEFYSSWCGYCQRFASSWKAFSNDIGDWKDMITVAVISCSDENNFPICRDFNIVQIPTLRYIHENYQEGEGKVGSDVEKDLNVHKQKLSLIKKILEEQRIGRGIQFPNILPYTYSDTKHLFDGTPKDTKYVFLIVEQLKNVTGPEIAFDLYEFSDIAVKYSLGNNTELVRNIGVSQLPALFVMGRDDTKELFSNFINTSRDDMKMVMREFLNSKSTGLELKTEKV